MVQGTEACGTAPEPDCRLLTPLLLADRDRRSQTPGLEEHLFGHVGQAPQGRLRAHGQQLHGHRLPVSSVDELHFSLRTYEFR